MIVNILVTEAPLDTPVVGNYFVSVAWRYGSSGGYVVADPTAEVEPDGDLVDPVLITFNDSINPSIEVKITYINCGSSVPFYVVYTSGGGTAPTTSTTSTTTTTTTTTSSEITVYWGFKSTNATLTPLQILAADYSDTITHNATVVADYTDNATPQYLWMAEPLTETAKTKWYGDSGNNGNIGAPSDLFGAPVTSGAFRFYITQYLTQNTDTPIEFRIS